MKYDVAIIGTGPAGLSAALNLKLHNKEIIWFGSPALSMKVEKSEKIANYPGLPQISGADLNEAFARQIHDAGLTITDKMVTQITVTRKGCMLLADNEMVEARTVLLATGTVSAKPLPGEEMLLGKGVSYCATCDGFLYKEKTIAVLCTAKRYEHEVAYLAELADKVYLSAPYEGCEVNLPNVEKLGAPITEITGEERVTGITLRDGTTKAVDGIFLLRTSVAPTALIKGLEMDGPHIVVNRQLETSKAGVFAAGDCTGRPYQITKATGEGNVAAHSILEYLAAKENPADEQIRRLAAEIEKKPEAQYMLFFKGRSVPATYQEAYENTNADGLTYMSVAFWDGDSGNLFDVDYRLVPERVLANGVEIFAKDIE